MLSLYAATIGVRVSAGGLALPTVCFLAACGLTLVGLSRSSLARFHVRLPDVVAVAYLGSRLVTEAMASQRLDHAADFGTAGNTLFYLAVYLVARVAVTSVPSLRRFLAVMVTPAPFVALVGVAQALDQPFITSIILRTTSSDAAAARLDDDRLTRATSTIGHWSALGGYLCCVIAMCLVAALIDRQTDRRSWWPVPVAAVAFLGVVSTLTVSVAVIAVGLVIAGAVALRRVLAGTAILALATVTAFVLFGSSIASRIAIQSVSRNTGFDLPNWLPATLAVRIPLWINEGIPAWLEHPVTGWGHSVYAGPDLGWPEIPLSIVWPYPESEYIKALVCGGVIELLALVLLLVVWGRTMWATRVVLGRPAASVLLVLLVGLAVGSFVNPFFTNQGVPSIIWPFVGALVFAIRRRSDA